MAELIAREMTKAEQIASRLKSWLVQIRRKYIPYLVFYGQEVDVRVTWKENRLQGGPYPDVGTALHGAVKQLNSGHLFKIEQMIGEIGIGFDKGLGPSGRDWEWDWSLDGPISVSFRAVCKTKDKRV